MMKLIYSFENHREFLKAYYLGQKKTSAGFSYAKFSEKAGLGSPNYLKLIIDGKKNLTIANIHQFARALNLRGDEQNYFEALVLKTQSSTRAETSFYHQRMKSIRQGKPKRALDTHASALLEKWYFPAILLWLSGKTPAEDLSPLRESLGMSDAELSDALDKILGEGLCVLRDGRYVLSEDHWLFRDKQAKRQAHQAFLTAQLERSKKSLATQYGSG